MQAHLRRYPRLLLTDLEDIHIRRTLDQFSLWFQDDTLTRDRDQVIYRETYHTGSPKIVMVDQLWMWVLDGSTYLLESTLQARAVQGFVDNIMPETIITAFPKRWDDNAHDSSYVHKRIRRLAANQRLVAHHRLVAHQRLLGLRDLAAHKDFAAWDLGRPRMPN